MSKEELRALAMKWATEDPTEAVPTEDQTQPRDEHGKFVKKDEPAPAPDEEVIYERIIDLGDGSGVQVFQAPTMEELIDKLAVAQENATRKIREQAAQLKTQPKPAQPPPDEVENLTEAEKFMLQQEMLTDPTKAISRFVHKAIEKREREQVESAAREKAESDAFVASTSDYYASPKNGQRMVKYLETYKLEANQENLKKAFDDLNSSGLLEARPKETPDAPTEDEPADNRIDTKPATQTVVRRKVVGGVSVRRSAPAPTSTPGLTEQQLRDMPMHELEALTRQALLG